MVQVGDLLDRGEDSKEIVSWVQELEEQARRAGGKVSSVMGNHEDMWMMGMIKYASDQEINSFAKMGPYLAMTHEQQILLKERMRQLSDGSSVSVATKIRTHGEEKVANFLSHLWFNPKYFDFFTSRKLIELLPMPDGRFNLVVHAELPVEWMKRIPTGQLQSWVDDLNQRYAEALRTRHQEPGFNKEVFLNSQSTWDLIFPRPSDYSGRGWATVDQQAAIREFDRLNIAHVLVGHDDMGNKVTISGAVVHAIGRQSRFDGRVVFTDVSLSMRAGELMEGGLESYFHFARLDERGQVSDHHVRVKPEGAKTIDLFRKALRVRFDREDRRAAAAAYRKQVPWSTRLARCLSGKYAGM